MHKMAHVACATVDWEGAAGLPYAALSSKDSRNFTEISEAIFKHYNINEETYHQRCQLRQRRESLLPKW